MYNVNTMKTKFKLGQQVYFMHDNKVFVDDIFVIKGMVNLQTGKDIVHYQVKKLSNNWFKDDQLTGTRTAFTQHLKVLADRFGEGKFNSLLRELEALEK